MLLFAFGKCKVLAGRRALKIMATSLEGGDFQSITARKMFEMYYGRTVGLYSGGAAFEPLCFDPPPPSITIGRFTSLASTMRAVNHDHPSGWKSTSPIFYNPRAGFMDRDYLERTQLTIGNDVWVGHNAIILRKTSVIHDGAVIAAGAVVNGDVPPYAIMAGYPARVVGYRFSEATIQRLLEEKWWEKSIDELKLHMDEFHRPLEKNEQSSK